MGVRDRLRPHRRSRLAEDVPDHRDFLRRRRRALAGAAKSSAAPSWDRAARVGAVALLAIGAIRLGGYAGFYPFGFDLLGFTEAPGPNAARMSPTTAASFVLAGTGLLLARRGPLAAFETVEIAGGLLSWLGVCRFLFGGEPLFHLHYMAIHTSVAFLALHIGILCLRREGLVGLMVSRGPAGEIARRLVPASLVVPMALGWLRLEGQRRGLYGTEAGVALLALSLVIVFGASSGPPRRG